MQRVRVTPRVGAAVAMGLLCLVDEEQPMACEKVSGDVGLLSVAPSWRGLSCCCPPAQANGYWARRLPRCLCWVNAESAGSWNAAGRWARRGKSRDVVIGGTHAWVWHFRKQAVRSCSHGSSISSRLRRRMPK